MPNDSSNNSNRIHRLLLPTKVPPPPIPPRLLSRFLESRKPSAAPTAADHAPMWIDRDEFAMASHIPTHTQAAPIPSSSCGPNRTLPHALSTSSHNFIPLHSGHCDTQFLSRGDGPSRANEHHDSSTTKCTAS